jgi:dTDP-4-amino-4,6-dideoxygalactose transaminase
MTQEVRAEVEQEFGRLLDTSRFVGGEVVERFEREWAGYCGTAHAVGVGNGTDALVLALRALGVGAGDEVVVPASTFIATAQAVVLVGAVPRFADVSAETLLLTPATLRAALTPRTKAVVPVHLYGQLVDMEGIVALARDAGIAVVEDAAQAHGASRDDRRAGSWGDVGCFSFYPGKNLGAFGDAGAVVTDDGEVAERIRSLRDHGRESGSHYLHREVGTNSRLDAVQAVVLSAKLRRLEEWTRARRRVVGWYRERLDPDEVPLVADASDHGSAHHLLVARLRDRERVRAGLERAGIQTGVHYPVPCHQQPPYRRFADRALPVAEEAAGEILSLPLFPHMTEEQVTTVCAELGDLVPAEGSRNVA